MTLQNLSLVHLLSTRGGSHGGDLVLREQVEREADTVRPAIAGMIVGRRYNVYPGDLQRIDHIRSGLENHALSGRLAFVGERRFQVDERDVGRGENVRDVPKRSGR